MPACRNRRRLRLRGLPAKQAQHGGMAITMMMVMLLLVSALGLVEIGYLFWAKRDVQKVADLAALAGAQRIELCAIDGNTAARSNAEIDNGFTGNGTALEIACGQWVPQLPAQDICGDDVHFLAGEDDPDAVLVIARRSAFPFFETGTFAITGCAVARSDLPRAAFTVGSSLARLDWEDDSRPLLAPLLEGLGLDLDGTQLISYNGLANARITPSGLLEQLGIPLAANADVGTVNELLAAREVSLGDLLNAVATLADQQSLLGVNADLLTAITARTGIDSLMVQLGSAAGAGAGLFAEIVAPDGGAGSALGAEVNALDLVYTAIGVATHGHAIAVNNLDLIPGLGVVEAKVAVIEPPSIGIGGIGATAYTAQVRTYVNINTNNLPLIGSLSSIVGVNVDLPIMIDTITGKGTIADMCTVGLKDDQGRDRARIDVNANILKVCIGRPGANPANENEIFSTVSSCETQLSNVQLLRVSLLGASIATLNAGQNGIVVNALPAQGEVILAEGESGRIGNRLPLGTTIRDVTDALFAAILVRTAGSTLSQSQRQQMAQGLWSEQGPPCTTRQCRQARLAAVEANIESAGQGLGGFLGSLTSNTLGILGDLLSLNLLGLINGVGNLVGGLLSTVGDILGGVLSIVTGHPCTGGGILNLPGSDTSCVNEIADALQGTSSGGGQQAQNALIALAGFLLDLLQPLLDGLGALLTDLLEDILGLRLGEVDVHLASLDCHHGAQIVY